MTQPGKPVGMADFFALEAGEYLERLDALLQPSEPPSADELVRLARALRGSALMANHQAIARAAAGLETLARAVRESRRGWDPQTKQLAVRAVDDLKIFVRRAASWTDADTAKAEALGQQLEHVAGRPPVSARGPEAPGLDAGARAFVAREGAAIASALDRTAQALQANRAAHDPLRLVLKAVQPLRGLAALNDLPPLPDLLEGIERAVAKASGSGPEPPPQVAELFQAAATAVARSAREVADRGRPDPEGAEFQTFAGLLLKFTEREPDVVPIGSLYYGDSGPHIVNRGTPAARPSGLGRLELVSQGEHLRQAADSLERAQSVTQRELRAHTLASTFRALGAAGGGILGESVAQLAAAAHDALATGVAVHEPAAFAAELRRAGDVLARTGAEGAGEEAALAAELDALIARIHALPHSRAAPVGPVGSSPPAPPPPPPPLAPAPADEPVPETPDLVGSWIAYQRHVQTEQAGIGPASLEELTAAGGRSPASRETGRGRAAGTVSASATVQPEVVDVRTLLYRGERALHRARELREVAKQAPPGALPALVEEVCDLVALARES